MNRLRSQLVLLRNAVRVNCFNPREIAYANRLTREAQDFGAVQLRGEFAPFLVLAARLRPGRILEIGLGSGGSLRALARVASGAATIVNIDLPAGPFGGLEDESFVETIRGYKREEQDLHLLRANSHDRETIEQASSLLGQPIDLLFIDGDHSYEGVKADFEDYGPLVRTGGLIGFHDIVPGAPGSVGGVPRLWREIKETRRGCIELVESWQQGGYGIGVVRV